MSKTKNTVEPGASQIIIARGLDAPRDPVFRVSADPEPLVRWLGSRDLWRYMHTDPQGNSYALAIRPPAPSCRRLSSRARRGSGINNTYERPQELLGTLQDG